ncbi:MAG: VOC family protein [Actinomyces sp.]|uniref:VOC family protein n=1 Tax=Actinomyces sp. TaxID=29317 RepID=UPI0026DCFF4A|nr:VOC family protein [Actinomyces sp.]MDO4244073.1 VOC family protein [Actinomyces sp.]
MTHLDHAAIWVADLDGARDFYSHWFNGHANGLYENPVTGLRSHILHFCDDGVPDGRRARLEIMTRPDVLASGGQAGLGWAHVSFAVPGPADVDRLASDMAQAGIEVVDGPRLTGDGYYEAVVLDPEGNRVEIVAGDYSPEVALRPAP